MSNCELIVKMENRIDRFKRFEDASYCLLTYNKNQNFINFIESNHIIFSDFKFTFSTNKFSIDWGKIDLNAIANQCDSIKKYYYGNGIIFYTDDIYSAMKHHGRTEIPVEFSYSFDSNVAEAVRVFVKNKTPSPKDKFYDLISYINKEELTFTYSFFIYENLEDAFNPNNTRPFETITALKRFETLNYKLFINDPKNPKFKLSQEEAYKKAIETISIHKANNNVQDLLLRRIGLYLLLLKTILLFWNNKKDFMNNFYELFQFCLKKIKKFAKMELYFCWKILKYGTKLSFFNPINQPGKNFLSKIKGMSWDLFFYRYQELMTFLEFKGKFHIPFFVSFDNKFLKLIEVCPIRCVLIDGRDFHINTIFDDEIEYTRDLNQILINNNNISFALNTHEKLKRFHSNLNKYDIFENIKILEKEINNILDLK